MHGRREHDLIVIENRQLQVYHLDDKSEWTIGRLSRENTPDIPLSGSTISREHGKFCNIDGVWYYIDKLGKNGTVYNNSRIRPGRNGQLWPIILEDQDVLIFGGGKEAVIDTKTVWAMFSEWAVDDKWRVEDTMGMSMVSFSGNGQTIRLDRPVKGSVIKQEDGMAIYMGDLTYLSGDIAVTGS